VAARLRAFTATSWRNYVLARLVADGMTNRQVARELVITVKTVEYHLGHVYTKLSVTSRSHLAAHLAIDAPPFR
jgi:DNA-binding CsgD family transcriptional regulator